MGYSLEQGCGARVMARVPIMLGLRLDGAADGADYGTRVAIMAVSMI